MSNVFAFCLGAVITGAIIGISNIIYDIIRRKRNGKKVEAKINDFFIKLKKEFYEEDQNNSGNADFKLTNSDNK